jgi:hypothetical protein
VLAKDTPAVLENDGGTTATVLLLTIVDASAGNGPATPENVLPESVTATVLAGGVEVTPRFGESRLLIGRATLAADTALAPHAASNPELVVVESGTLRLTVAGMAVSVRRGADGTIAESGGVVLAAGDGALVPPGALVDLRAETTGSTIVVVRIVADAPGERDSSAGKNGTAVLGG